MSSAPAPTGATAATFSNDYAFPRDSTSHGTVDRDINANVDGIGRQQRGVELYDCNFLDGESVFRQQRFDPLQQHDARHDGAAGKVPGQRRMFCR